MIISNLRMFSGLQSCLGYPTRSEHLIKVMDAFCLPLSWQPSSHTAVYGSWPRIPQPTWKGPFLWARSSDKPPENFPGRQAAGRQRRVCLSQLPPPCALPNLPSDPMVMSVTDNSTNLFRNTPEHKSSSVLLGWILQKMGDGTQPPLACQECGWSMWYPGSWHTLALSGATAEAVNRALSPPRVSGGVESALQYVLWCCGEGSYTLSRMPLGTEATISKICLPTSTHRSVVQKPASSQEYQPHGQCVKAVQWSDSSRPRRKARMCSRSRICHL